MKTKPVFKCRVFMRFVPLWAGTKCVVMVDNSIFGTIQFPKAESRNNDDGLIAAEVTPEFAQPVAPALNGQMATLQVEGFGTLETTVKVCPAKN